MGLPVLILLALVTTLLPANIVAASGLGSVPDAAAAFGRPAAGLAETRVGGQNLSDNRSRQAKPEIIPTSHRVYPFGARIRTSGPPVAPNSGPPNPYGKLGNPAHRGKVAEIADEIEARGLIPDFEVPIKTVNGKKAARYMDVVARDPVTREIVEVHQVGKTLKSKPMIPVARERDALRDVRYSPEVRKAKKIFHKY
ncbi:MAG: hypothetical protein KA419_13420 [Acidobacteria bacterium]|nr:hypothetical protein [Acidobacteriota bacterium]